MFKHAVFVILLFSVALSMDLIKNVGGSTIDVTVSNCTKSTDEGKITKLTIDPPSPEKVNQNFTVAGIGSADVDISAGTFTLVAKVAGIPVLNENGDICKAQSYKLPQNAGTLYYNGVKCPISKGANIVFSMTAFVTSSAPDDSVKISLTAKDSKTKNEILCIDSTVSIKG
eukprot:533313_1